MKLTKISIAILFCICSILFFSISAFAQDTGTEKNEKTDEIDKNDKIATLVDPGEMDYSWYAAPVVRYGQFGNINGLLAGARGGFILNRKLVLGAGGCGYPGSHKRGINSGEGHVYLGYGGFMCEYYFFPKQIVHLSLGLLTGAGGIYYKVDGGSSDSSAFFVMEPEINLFLNVTEFFRVGIGAAYRFVRGIDTAGVSDSNYRGFSGHIVFAFGAF
ncbi:MAG: hypothetical protein GY754_20665 [bacterium]|nr:hypothetical protein [bacterium]